MEVQVQKKGAKLKPGRLFLMACLGLFAALGSGILLSLFWNHQGLAGSPPAWSWPGSWTHSGDLSRFMGIYLCALAWLPSLALALLSWQWPLSRKKGVRTVNQALSLDAATYLALPVIVLTPLIWRQLGNGFLALALTSMALLAVKSAILAWSAWQGFLFPQTPEKGASQRSRMLVFFMVAFICLGLAAAWSQEVSPPSGLEAQRLAGAGSPFAEASFASSQDGKANTTSQGLYGWVLAFSANLGGRLGGVLFSAFWAALAGTLLWRWLCGLGLDFSETPVALGLLFFSVPVLRISQKAGPEALSLFLLCLALVFRRRMSHRFWSSLTAASVSLACLAALLFFVGDYHALAQEPGTVLTRLLRSTPIYLLCAPIFLLALAGLPQALRTYPRAGLDALAPSLLGLFWLAIDQGSGAAVRGPMLLLMSLPLLGLGLVFCFQGLNRPWVRLVLGMAALVTLVFSWLRTMSPALWEIGPDLSSPVLAALTTRLGSGLSNLLPLPHSETGLLLAWGGLWLLLCLLLSLVLSKNQKQVAEQSPKTAWSHSEVMTLLLSLAVLTLMALLFVRWI